MIVRVDRHVGTDISNREFRAAAYIRELLEVYGTGDVGRPTEIARINNLDSRVDHQGARAIVRGDLQTDVARRAGVGRQGKRAVYRFAGTIGARLIDRRLVKRDAAGC